MSSPRRSGGLPQFNPGTVVLLLVVALGGAWAAGLWRPRYDSGRLSLCIFKSGRELVAFELRDTWLLLALALVMGWAVAAAVEHSAWVPETEGRLIPALAFATVLGFLLATARFSRGAYLLASLPVLVICLALWTPSPLTGGGSLDAIRKWAVDLPNQTHLLLLIGMLAMFVTTGLWTSWWVFSRRNGLVALLPTGTILAVEIINDTSPGLAVFTLLWLAAAASVLLRLNFVSLKESWRTRRLPHAADTGWTFGEVGIEATAGILVIAFLVLPPLSSTDISAWLIPGVVHTDSFHPFGFGSGSQSGSVGSIGYSEQVRPGSQLKARSQTVMVVSGDSPTYYPYWRGIALGGWDGIAWYELPSTRDVPVRQQPVVTAGATIPRDDLPADTQRTQILHNTFRVAVPLAQTLATVFTAGELLSVNQPTTIQGIMTSAPAPLPGPVPTLVNVIGDSSLPSKFDTIDHIHFIRRLQQPYTYSVAEAIPNVDVADLQKAGTDYPGWVQPYISLYYGDRTAQGYSTARDAEIATTARSIVNAAGAVTPYDQSKAIESWFLVKGRFTYTLTHATAPVGVRPLDDFLFGSRKGLCQDFSTAMNVMLRTLGIPSRQMSGFGVGVLDEKTHQWTVNSLDAHSWVEVYFPGYGWIPFEPTPDGSNAPVNRPATRDALTASAPPATETTSRPRINQVEAPNNPGITQIGSSFPDIARPLMIAGVILLVLLLIAALLAVRWLMAVRDVPRIWRRLLFLGDRLRVPRHPGDTPEEFGGRLAGSIPPLDAEVRRLARLYTRSSFRRGGLTTDELAEARQAWSRIRGSYPALVARAWRDALRHGRVVSAAEDAASRNPEPSRRR
jgi:transglutaminase-like putative cysteine protease